MPIYVYEALEDSLQQFEFRQAINDEPYTQHPQTGIAIQRIIVPGAAVKIHGLKKGTKVNKRSPAATACACSSNRTSTGKKRRCSH